MHERQQRGVLYGTARHGMARAENNTEMFAISEEGGKEGNRRCDPVSLCFPVVFSFAFSIHFLSSDEHKSRGRERLTARGRHDVMIQQHRRRERLKDSPTPKQK